jgi:hypothetical protein
MPANRIALTIIVSIILTIIVVSLVNVGMTLVKDNPEYNDYCDIRTQEQPTTLERCEELGGKWNAEGKTYPRQIPTAPEQPEIDGYCDLYYTCNMEWEEANKAYNQLRFYVFAGIGFILLLVGLFSPELMIQLTGLATGGILVSQGIIINFENELIVFISLLAILVIFGVVAYRIINRKKN